MVFKPKESDYPVAAPAASVETAKTSQIPVLKKYLKYYNLPTYGISGSIENFLVLKYQSEIVAFGGMEYHEPDALIRSVCVLPGTEGKGYGGQVVDTLIARASDSGIRDLYLFTHSAEGFFSRFGFRRLDKQDCPPTIRNSSQFQDAMCQDASFMIRDRVD